MEENANLRRIFSTQVVAPKLERLKFQVSIQQGVELEKKPVTVE